MGRNLAQDVQDRAAADPDRIALINQNGRRWTFRELDAAAGTVAKNLSRVAARGERVGLHLQNSPELVIGLLGAWKAGLVAVAMSGLYGAEELAHCVEKTDPVVLVGDPDVAGQVARTTGVTFLPAAEVSAALDSATDFPAVEVADDEPGLILFTGGSTGEPKAVATTHQGSYVSMTNLAGATKAGDHVKGSLYPIADESVPPNLVLLPLFHGGGIQSLLFAWHVGRTVVLATRFSVDVVADLVPRYRINNLFLLPTMVYDLVHAPVAPDLRTVRKVLVAGQRLDPGLQAEFEHRFGVIVVSNYGSTELGHVAGWNSRDVKEGRWKPGSVGRVYDGVQVEVRDPDGNALATGEAGEIWVRSSKTAGYVGRGGVVDGEELIRDGWVRSGDIGRLDEDRVLFLLGRERELIKTGGFQVWPGELEQVMRRHPGVTDVAVVGEPDLRLGEIPVAYVVPGDPAPTEAELIGWCRDHLSHFKAIRAVRFLDQLPRSEAGKVQRALLTPETVIDAGGSV